MQLKISSSTDRKYERRCHFDCAGDAWRPMKGALVPQDEPSSVTCTQVPDQVILGRFPRTTQDLLLAL